VGVLTGRCVRKRGECELGGYWVDLGGAKWRYKSYQFYLKTQAGWTEKTLAELSRAEEQREDWHWTAEVVR